ncbi:cytochrome C assembly family protein [Arhodomonas aquaeolei]|uniref:cytochrome C assembly family protein n=1 Tax=Arhodomonas aquaeolei TaxID=2369 RepID=UPI00037D629B|nr:cytochrome c biogenesis protein CcsA [Arhodomonas aquaeolei]
MIHPLLTITVIALYLAATVVLVLRLTRRLPAREGTRQAAIALAVAGVALHAVILSQTIWQSNGLDLRLFNAGALIGWVMAALLVLAAVREPVESLGVIVFPIGAASVLAQYCFGVAHTTNPVGFAGVDSHVLLSVIAYSVLGIAAAQSVVLAVQERQLRNRHPGGFLRLLPALQDMDALLFTMLRVGFVLLTASLATGWFFVQDLFAQHLVHKTVLTVLAWALFAMLLLGRRHYGWRGQVAARWSIAAFLVLALGYFGSKIMLELVLGA